MNLEQIFSFVLTNVVPFLVALFPVIGFTLKKIKDAQKETIDVINAVSSIVDEVTDVIAVFHSSIDVDDKGNVKIDPNVVSNLIKEAEEVSEAASRVKLEINEMVESWKSVFTKV